MPGTAPTAATFFCPACGAGLRAPRADRGYVIQCDHCGAPVRAPRHPHPLECDADDAPLLPPTAARAAADGVRWLTTGLAATGAALLVFAASVGVAVALEGAPAAANRETPRLRAVAGAGAAAELVLLAAAGLFRWVGYAKCRPAAELLRARGWLAAARAGVLLGVLGAALAAIPAASTLPADRVPVVARALGALGDVARALGFVLEFGILFVWMRLLTEVGGRSAARGVAQYAAGAAAAGIGVFGAACASGAVVVLALRQNGMPPPPAQPGKRFDFAQLPPDAWHAAYAFAAVLAVAAAWMGWSYWRLLRQVRERLAAT